MSQRLGDLLVKEKIITPEQLEQANKVQKEQSCRLGSALVKLGFLTDEDVTNFLSRQYGVPAINLSYFEIDPAVVKLIPFETAKRYQILPLSRVGASLTIAMQDRPDDDHQRIQEVHRTVPTAGLVNHQADQDEVGKYLQGRLNAMLLPEREQKHVEEREAIPEQDRADEQPHGNRRWTELRHCQFDG